MNRRAFLSAGVVVSLSGCTANRRTDRSRYEATTTGTSTTQSGTTEPESTGGSTTEARTTESTTTEPETTEEDSSDTTLAGTPYDGVDWDTCGRHKGQFHVHPHYGSLGPPQEVYDHYVDLGYDVVCVQPKGDLELGMPWPLEEMGDVHDQWESRYPGEDGVVAIPGVEYTDTKHVTGFFTELMQETLYDVLGSGSTHDPEHQYDTVEQILDSDPTPETVSPLAFISHPGRYREELSDDEWEDRWFTVYRRMIEDFDTLLGLEAITYSFGYDDRAIWDRLLEHATPDRPVMGTSVDDIGQYEDADRGWVTFYLSPEEFSPTDQRATRESVYEAWTSGRTSFSTTTEPGAEAPTIDVIERDVDAGRLVVEASGHDVIEWVSHGDVVETGESIDYRDSTDVGSYVRAQIVEGDPRDPDSITCTQAWY